MYLGSGLVMPSPWFYFMWVAWVTGWWFVVRVYRSKPMWTPGVSLGAVVFWVAVIQLGSWLAGWTA